MVPLKRGISSFFSPNDIDLQSSNLGFLLVLTISSEASSSSSLIVPFDFLSRPNSLSNQQKSILERFARIYSSLIFSLLRFSQKSVTSLSILISMFAILAWTCSELQSSFLFGQSVLRRGCWPCLIDSGDFMTLSCSIVSKALAFLADFPRSQDRITTELSLCSKQLGTYQWIGVKSSFSGPRISLLSCGISAAIWSPLSRAVLLATV